MIMSAFLRQGTVQCLVVPVEPRVSPFQSVIQNPQPYIPVDSDVIRKIEDIMKRTISITLLVLILGGATGLLLYNKSQLDARAQLREHQAPAVRVQHVERSTAQEQITLLGTLEPWRSVDIISETQGRISSVHFERGDMVRRGTPLAAVDSSVSHARMVAAAVALRNARKNAARYEALHRAGNATDADLERAHLACSEAESHHATTAKALRDAVVRAPFDGILTARHVEVGSMMMPGTRVARLVDIRRFRFRTNAAAQIVRLLHPGQSVTIAVDESGPVRLKGSVSYIAPEADAVHLFDIEVAVDNPGDAGLRAGMMGTMLLAHSTEPALLAPRTAVARQGDRAWVFVLENGCAQKRPVTLGKENGSQVQVLSGLQEGERLIVSSHQTLRDGIAVDVRSTESRRKS